MNLGVIGDMAASDLNMALTDLRDASVREGALVNMALYLDKYDLTNEEREAILNKDWVTMWRLGASTYAMNKLRHINRVDHDQLGPLWRGGSPEDLEDFLTDQNARNAPFAYPVEEIV